MHKQIRKHLQRRLKISTYPTMAKIPILKQMTTTTTTMRITTNLVVEANQKLVNEHPDIRSREKLDDADTNQLSEETLHVKVAVGAEHNALNKIFFFQTIPH